VLFYCSLRVQYQHHLDENQTRKNLGEIADPEGKVWVAVYNMTIIGIDLGTTSCLGEWKDERVEIIANEQAGRENHSFLPCFPL